MEYRYQFQVIVYDTKTDDEERSGLFGVMPQHLDQLPDFASGRLMETMASELAAHANTLGES